MCSTVQDRFRRGLLAACVMLGAGVRGPDARAASPYVFDAFAGLAAGAINGTNVATRVPGYEVLLIKDGQTVFHQAFGAYAKNRVANMDSSTKTFAGGLIMSLVDASASPFSLDTRIGEYVPSFTGAKANITVRQAFSHTSGLGDSNAIGASEISLQQAAAIIGATTPVSYGPPGTQFSYGGTSMHAAGAAAEIAGGKSWDALFAERITGPLGLANTRYALSGPTNPRIAGGVETTGAEFGRFMDTLLNDGVDRATGTRVLSSASVGAMLARQTASDVTLVNTPLPGVTDYGVGIWLDERDAAGTLTGAVAGGARGFSSWLDLDDDFVGVIATDLTTFSNIRDLHYLMRDAAADAFGSPALIGDANRDGTVGFDDLLALAQHFDRRVGQRWADGDFDGDGSVQFDDLLALAQNYGSPASFATDWVAAQSLVPEPAGLLGVGLLVGLVCRRRAGVSVRGPVA